MDLKNHNYIDFIKQVMQAGHKIQWDEFIANVILKKSGWKIRAHFSYNETKIYFEFGQPHPFRVLGRGEASKFIDALDERLAGVQEIMRDYEG